MAARDAWRTGRRALAMVPLVALLVVVSRRSTILGIAGAILLALAALAQALGRARSVFSLKLVVGPQRARQALPWDQRATSWYCVPTELRESSIPGAGLGRYILRDAKAGSTILCLKVQSVADFISENEKGCTTPIGVGAVAIRLQSMSDIEAFCNHFVVPLETADNIDMIKAKAASFIGAVPVKDGSGRNMDFALSHSFHVNHACGQKANTWGFMRPNQGAHGVNYNFVAYATRDIAAGEELCADYTGFGLSSFVKEWAQQQGLVDVHTFATNLQDSSARDGAGPGQDLEAVGP